jgi:16S rRNA (adenine1518-N6/adenine1519-N6)-dimethyltransferase
LAERPPGMAPEAVSAGAARPAPASPDLPPLRDVIARHGLAARHSLGQHFLLDGNLTDRIVREAGDLAGRHIIEIGPGPGGLTRSLLGSAAASITAIELDRRAIGAVTELEALAGGRLRVIEGDALSVDAATLVPAPRQIIANLPYNVASPLLVRWLRQAAAFERLTLMFQQEVAERICAEPGTPAYGRLSVLVQWTCEARIVLRLPPGAFTPPPKVWSAVVSLTPLAAQPAAALFARMEALTAAAFGQRRKMLRGSLRGLGGEALLARAGIDPQRRAETLSVAEFDRLVGLTG